MTTMAEEDIPINFTLISIDGVLFDNPPKFIVPTTSGKTLFEALTTFEQSNTKFSFRTRNAPNVGHYVVEVIGKKNQPDQFWETLLRNPNNDIIPINLDYKVRGGDTVYLQFTPILFLCGTKK